MKGRATLGVTVVGAMLIGSLFSAPVWAAKKEATKAQKQAEVRKTVNETLSRLYKLQPASKGAIEKAALSAAERLKRHVTGVSVESGTGERVLKSLEASLISFGARALLEHGRSLAADAVLRWARGSGRSKTRKLTIAAGQDGELTVLD